MSTAQLWWRNKMRKRIDITIIFVSLLILSFVPVRGYALNSAREITYKNVNTVLTKEDIELRGENYLFSGLTDTLPYTVTEDDLGINDLAIYDGENMRMIKIVVTDASREVDRDGWTIIEASPDTRIVYVSSSEGDDDYTHPDSRANFRPGAHNASDIGVINPDDKPVQEYESLLRVNPVMTGNDEPEGVASASNYGGGLNPWNAFDSRGGWHGWRAGYDTSGWIQYKFSSPKVVSGYVIENRGSGDPDSAPKNWTFEASNDSESWIILQEVLEEEEWKRSEVREFQFANTQEYQYYRLNISENNGADRLHLSEFQLLGPTIVEVNPVETISKADSLIRDGYADWMLLKKGDVWENQNIIISKNGFSSEKRLKIAAYGNKTERPRVGRIRVNSNNANNILISGLGVSRINSWFSQQGGRPKNVLIEDVKTYSIDSDTYDMTLSGIDNLELRRNVIAEPHPEEQQYNAAIYGSGNKGWLLEENRWHNFLGPDTETQTHKRNMVYIAASNRNVTFVRNIVTDSARHGAQIGGHGRSIVMENILARHRHPLEVGLRPRLPDGFSVNAYIKDNIIMEGRPNNPNSTPWSDGCGIMFANFDPDNKNVVSGNIIFNPDKSNNNFPSGNGGLIASTWHNVTSGMQSAVIKKNIVYNWSRSMRLSNFEGKVQNVLIHNNLIQNPIDRSDSGSSGYLARRDNNGYDLSDNIYFQYDIDVSDLFVNKSTILSWEKWLNESGETGSEIKELDFLDTNRTLGTYQEKLKEQKNPSFDGYDHNLPWPDEGMRAFVKESYQQSSHNWEWDYHPVRILEYFREGFTVLADPESIKISGPKELEIPVSGEKNQIYAIEIRDENDTLLKDEPYNARIVDNPHGVSLSGTRLTVTPQAEPGDIVIEVKLEEYDEIKDEFTVTLLYDKAAPDKVLPERDFITPSNPELKFGEEAKEVLITDVRGNEVFRKEKGTSRFIIWNPGKRGTVSIESGIYIYRIKTKDGYEYGTVVVAK